LHEIHEEGGLPEAKAPRCRMKNPEKLRTWPQNSLFQEYHPKGIPILSEISGKNALPSITLPPTQKKREIASNSHPQSSFAARVIESLEGPIGAHPLGPPDSLPPHSGSP
jgi:hypothetical protein